MTIQYVKANILGTALNPFIFLKTVTIAFATVYKIMVLNHSSVQVNEVRRIKHARSVNFPFLLVDSIMRVQVLTRIYKESKTKIKTNKQTKKNKKKKNKQTKNNNRQKNKKKKKKKKTTTKKKNNNSVCCIVCIRNYMNVLAPVWCLAPVMTSIT